MVSYDFRSRRVAARPIPLDKAVFKKLVDDELVPELVVALKRMKQDEPIGVNRRLGFNKIVINPVGGRGPLQVTITVRSVQTNSDDAVVSGQAALIPHDFWEDPTVEMSLNLNGRLTPAEYLGKRSSPALDRKYLHYGLYSVLIHELTHVMEMPFMRAQPYALSDDHKPADPEEYVNSPTEVRAFMQQIVDEVLIWAKRPLARMDAKGSNRRLVDALLNYSATWKKVQKWLNAVSRKKILSAVYDALDKGGFLYQG